MAPFTRSKAMAPFGVVSRFQTGTPSFWAGRLTLPEVRGYIPAVRKTSHQEVQMRVLTAMTALLLAVVISGPVHGADDFYKGKKIRLIVSVEPGRRQ